MERITNLVDTILTTVLIIIMAAMVLDVTWQVFSRFILRQPSSFTEELATFLLIWIGLLGASYAVRTKSHLGIDLISRYFKGISRIYLDVFVYFCIFIFALTVMVIGGSRLVILTLTLKQVSASLNIMMGYVYLVIPLSGVLIMFYSLVDVIKTLTNKQIIAPTYADEAEREPPVSID